VSDHLHPQRCQISGDTNLTSLKDKKNSLIVYSHNINGERKINGGIKLLIKSTNAKIFLFQ